LTLSEIGNSFVVVSISLIADRSTDRVDIGQPDDQLLGTQIIVYIIEESDLSGNHYGRISATVPGRIIRENDDVRTSD